MNKCSRGARAKIENVKCKTERDENFCETENVYKNKNENVSMTCVSVPL